MVYSLYMSLVENFNWISDEQKSKWKAEGHWPPAGSLLNPEPDTTTQEIIDLGKEIENVAVQNEDHVVEAIGKTMQFHPKSHILVLLSKIVKTSELPRIDGLIKKVESE